MILFATYHLSPLSLLFKCRYKCFCLSISQCKTRRKIGIIIIISTHKCSTSTQKGCLNVWYQDNTIILSLAMKELVKESLYCFYCSLNIISVFLHCQTNVRIYCCDCEQLHNKNWLSLFLQETVFCGVFLLLRVCPVFPIA